MTSPHCTLTTCSICCEPYKLTGAHVPYLITGCSHTFCLGCMYSMSEPCNNPLKRMIKCPTCRQVIVMWVSSEINAFLRKDWTMMHLLQGDCCPCVHPVAVAVVEPEPEPVRYVSCVIC